ncbi:MAG: FAD-binding protein [Ruminococcus sp.]|nr:FAD-binding protein [Ruminococcus sp.]
MMGRINIIGAGLAGLSAGIHLAKAGIPCSIFSLQISERSQSVLAEGGVNGALDTMGEGDVVENHFNDTMKGGVFMADPNAVENLTHGAPEILRWLESIGVPFNMENGRIVQRNFGGQKKKRTAYAKSSTGKIIMSAVIDEARKYEAKGLIKRYPHHEFIRLILENKTCTGVRIKNCYTGEMYDFRGAVILCSGGMNGIFPEKTTGTTQNSGDVTATVFAQGALIGNPEMVQYHPTTIGISGKRCLVTEAARGEGGRLYIERNGEKWYFMEEKYPELKNLMPRDVVAREMFFVRRMPECGDKVYLDMTGLDEKVWSRKLSDLREELIKYLNSDPKTTPIHVEEGIHYFMGGIDTDEFHRTNIKDLYAAGECTCQYHGANRLGGNSMLGALFGGKKSAETVISCGYDLSGDEYISVNEDEPLEKPASPVLIQKISEILLSGLGIVRNQTMLENALEKLYSLEKEREYNSRETNRFRLAEAMLKGALERHESRGAHYREDYPEKNEEYRKTTVAEVNNNSVSISFRPLAERRNHEGNS